MTELNSVLSPDKTQITDLPVELLQQIRVYLQSFSARMETTSVLPLSGDGSSRIYYRIHCPDAPSFLAVDGSSDSSFTILPANRHEPARDPNHSFHLIRAHLEERSFLVPALLASNPAGNYYLLEDLGDITVFSQVKENDGPVGMGSLYEKIILLLVRLQCLAAEGFPATFCYAGHRYDRELIESAEIGYFLREFVSGYAGLNLTRQHFAALHREMAALLREAGNADHSFFLYRDFQSKNLMLKNNLLYLIDFQGAKLGPCYYDLASLLNDPYTQLPAALKNHLLQFYYAQMSNLRKVPVFAVFDSHFKLFSLFRIMQNLGAYAFLGRSGKKQFYQYISGALKTFSELISTYPLDLPILAELCHDCQHRHKKKRPSES